MKPIIGIIGRPDIKDRTMIKVNDSYRNAIIYSGGIPLLILPNQLKEYAKELYNEVPSLSFEEEKDLIRVLELCDGILMPGGIDGYEYDKFICKYCIENNKPTLGICLGMQIMSYYDNEYSLELIDTKVFNHNKQDKYVHEVIIEDNTLLSSIVKGKRFMVNSRHNCRITTLGKYKVSAVSKDGIIEAIEYPDNKFNIGIQWHPEDLLYDDDNSKRIFDRFIEVCKR